MFEGLIDRVDSNLFIFRSVLPRLPCQVLGPLRMPL